jgi:hypothetical protein
LRFSAEVLEEVLGDEQAQRGVGGVGGKAGVYLGAGIFAARVRQQGAGLQHMHISHLRPGQLDPVPRCKGCIDVAGGVLPCGQFGEVGGLFGALGNGGEYKRSIRKPAQGGQRIGKRMRCGVILRLGGVNLVQQAQSIKMTLGVAQLLGLGKGGFDVCKRCGHGWACVLAPHRVRASGLFRLVCQTAVCSDGGLFARTGQGVLLRKRPKQNRPGANPGPVFRFGLKPSVLRRRSTLQSLHVRHLRQSRRCTLSEPTELPSPCASA